MVPYNKFETFTGDLCGQVHDLIGTTPGVDCDVCNVYLSNAAPSASADSVFADLAEIATGNGYTGPQAVTNNGAEATGTVTFDGVSLQITASGGTIGPFQYVALYNDTPTSPADPLIAWWDYASALTLGDGESFSILFNGVAVASRGTIFTLV